MFDVRLRIEGVMSPLVVENATKRFHQGQRAISALNGVSLEVPSGSFLAIMGASGSGKSTLLHLMAGLTRADSGRILIAGQDIAAMSDSELTLFRRQRIGLVFQAFNLIPTLTAEENISLPLMLSGQNGQASRGRVTELMATLNIADRRGHRPDALSGGEQQRVAIGRALVTDPAVILADEPTGNLDSVNSDAICALLRDLSVVHQKTIVMVTHEPTVAAYAAKTIVLKDGKILSHGATPTSGEAGIPCSNCGAHLPADAAFCHKCGRRLNAAGG
jgi:putative ABC transport system ATP-binding protein